MTTTSIHDLPDPLRAQTDSLFAGIGQGFNAYIERRSRRAEIEYLHALSDTELAAMGLKPELIAFHVFRDRLGL